MQSTRRIEANIQRALVRWIAGEYPHLMVQATLNEMARTQVDMGMCVGITDLLIFERVDDVLRVLFLELKKKDGKLSPSQIKWGEKYSSNIVSSNTAYAVAYGFTQAKNIVSQWVIKKT